MKKTHNRKLTANHHKPPETTVIPRKATTNPHNDSKLKPQTQQIKATIVINNKQTHKSRKKKKKTEPKITRRAEIKLGDEDQAPDRRRCEREIGSTARIKLQIDDGARDLQI
jgi:hypothetical protein